MKIAMIGQKGIPALFGGIERHVEELSARLVLQGHEVLVFCRSWYTPLAKTEHRGVKIVHVPTIHTKHLDAIIHTFVSLIKAQALKVDVYHIHGVGPSLLAWLPRLIAPKAKVITTFHCIDRKHTKWNFFARMMLRLGEWAACQFAHKAITVSKTLHQYCIEAYDTETAYIPNGIGKVMSANPEHLAHFHLEPNKYLLFVARLVPHKRAHDLIAAWQELRTERPDLITDLKLAIVGDSAFTDPYVAKLREMAQGDNSIIFTGYQNGETLAALFGQAIAYVNASESEGLPIATLEAMAFGKPVIASDIAENLEITEDFGINYARRDAHALAEKIEWLLEHRAEAAELGLHAQTFVNENFHWNDIAVQTSALYNQAIA